VREPDCGVSCLQCALCHQRAEGGVEVTRLRAVREDAIGLLVLAKLDEQLCAAQVCGGVSRVTCQDDYGLLQLVLSVVGVAPEFPGVAVRWIEAPDAVQAVTDRPLAVLAADREPRLRL
jgi:hypothetical protein